jgi:tRNA G10  N-methylase Trm11
MGRLKPLYRDFLGEAHKILKKGGRLVLVTPYIKTRSEKPVTMRIEEEAVLIGFEKAYPFQKSVIANGEIARDNLTRMASFIDVAEKHKIGREIHVFQK